MRVGKLVNTRSNLCKCELTGMADDPKDCCLLTSISMIKLPLYLGIIRA
jgi:hypothetical protein